MNLSEIKTTLCIVVMLILVLMAFSANNLIDSRLFAGLGIIFGAIASRNLSTQHQRKNE